MTLLLLQLHGVDERMTSFQHTCSFMQDDFAQNKEFITLVVYKTDGKKVYYPGGMFISHKPLEIKLFPLTRPSHLSLFLLHPLQPTLPPTLTASA